MKEKHLFIFSVNGTAIACTYTLTIKLLHDTVLSKWFHEEPLTSKEALFHQQLFVVNVSSDYKMMLFTEPLTLTDIAWRTFLLKSVTES